MERLIEFIGNNLFWVSLWVAILMLLIWNLYGDLLMGITQLEPMDVTRLINHDHATMIDLRSPSEFESGHILNAINLPEADFSNKKQVLDKYRKKPLILYCQNGTNSRRLVKLLKTDGFENVSSMKGGISTWQRASLPLNQGKTK